MSFSSGQFMPFPGFGKLRNALDVKLSTPVALLTIVIIIIATGGHTRSLICLHPILQCGMTFFSTIFIWIFSN